MSETPLPASEEIQEALMQAEAIREEIIHYRAVAQEIDKQFERANEERRLSLDDMPYGEELIKTRGLPDSIDEAIDLLTQIETGKISSANVIDTFQEAEEIIEEARHKLDGCTPLPPEEDDDE